MLSLLRKISFPTVSKHLTFMDMLVKIFWNRSIKNCETACCEKQYVCYNHFHAVLLEACLLVQVC